MTFSMTAQPNDLFNDSEANDAMPKAKVSCLSIGDTFSDHFVDVTKMLSPGKAAKKFTTMATKEMHKVHNQLHCSG